MVKYFFLPKRISVLYLEKESTAMIVVLFWLIGILSLWVGVCPMSKQPSDLLSVSIVPFVRKLRPAAATGYRLLDGQNRLFPPLEQPPYHARARIDSPDVPAGLYGIRFEDAEGNNLAYTDDGTLAEIQLDGCAVVQTPDEVSIYHERGWQGIEKNELRHKRKHIRNGSLQNFAGMLHDAHGLLFESHREVKESQKYVTDMIRNVMDLQRTMLEQQKALTVQAQNATPPPAPENWASATPKILRELGDVVKVAMMATSTDRTARSSPGLLEAQPKPAAALEHPAPAASAEDASSRPAAAKSPATERAAEPPASTLLASAPLPQMAVGSLVAAQPPISAAPLAPPPAAPVSVGAESMSVPAPLVPSAPPSGTAAAPLAASAAPAAALSPAPLAQGAPLVTPLAPGESPLALAAPAPLAAAVSPAVALPAESAPNKPKLPPPDPPSASPPPPSPAAPSAPPPTAAAPSAAAAPSSDTSAQCAGHPGLSESPKSLVRALPTVSPQVPPAPDPRASGARLLLWRLRCMLAQGLWKEIKRRIISLPDSTLHLAVSNRETFLAWLQWVAEPAKLLRGTP